MTALPIDQHIGQIVQTLRARRSLVLIAEPGAGKTTRVPPAIVRAGVLGSQHPNVVMLQPRRVAARAAAARIAQEDGSQVGEFAGYQIRFERRIGPDTRVRVLTEGILTRQLLDDPSLSGVGCVVLDEFHERNINTDLAIAMLQEVRESVRSDLLLLVMSATVDADPVSRFLGDAPIMRIPGRTFPVEVAYSAPSSDALAMRVRDAVEQSPAEGDVLVFLPGVDEIRRAREALQLGAGRHGWDVVPLHGSLPAEQQYAALLPSRQRKIILSTNIAETSLTIDGVRTVIDSGLVRKAGFDPQRGLDRLDVARISRASAEQRAGRAGRTAPGRCVRLWTEKEQHQFDEFDVPEIHRVDLCGVVLSLHAWGTRDSRAFGWFDPPPDDRIAAAERLLWLLGAIDSESNGRLTRLGERLLTFPAHPRLARQLLAARDAGFADEGAAIAAILSEKDFVLDKPATQHDSDAIYRLDLLHSRHADVTVDRQALRAVARAHEQFARMAGDSHRASDLPTRPHDRDRALRRAVLQGFPDRVCRRRASDHQSGTMVGGSGVRLARESVVARDEFFVALDARTDDRSATRQSLVRLASSIEREWLDELFPQLVREERQAIYDPVKRRVVGRRATYYLDLLIDESLDSNVDATQAGEVLAAAHEGRAREIIESIEPARQLLRRIALLARVMPEHSWPVLDERALADVLRDACRGQRSMESACGRIPQVVQSLLAYPLDRLLDQHAPEAIVVPTGNHIRLDYLSGDVPVLAVRLQELFGLQTTPRVAGGRVAVVLHLLGPNFRPVQVTDDLASFWKNTYPQVRKDLRARYPKHSWPDDPTTAAPQSKGGKRR